MDKLKERRILIAKTVGQNETVAKEALEKVKELDARLRDLIFWCD